LLFTGSYLAATEAGIEIGTVYRAFARFLTCYLPAVICMDATEAGNEIAHNLN
jgi:hypothetical protein